MAKEDTCTNAGIPTFETINGCFQLQNFLKQQKLVPHFNYAVKTLFKCITFVDHHKRVFLWACEEKMAISAASILIRKLYKASFPNIHKVFGAIFELQALLLSRRRFEFDLRPNFLAHLSILKEFEVHVDKKRFFVNFWG